MTRERATSASEAHERTDGTGDGWGSVREDLEADVRRVTERLRNLSVARLAAPPAPPEGGWPAYLSRAQAGRAAASELAVASWALEAAAEGVTDEGHGLPRLSDFAVADQIAVTGLDLLAAMERVRPDTRVWTSTYDNPTAADAVAFAARVLADVRRRI